MRKLSEQTGVQAPSTDYVKGRIVDNQTPVNEAINGDFVEFFHRLAWMAGIAENNLPDNVTNGHQLLQALQWFVETYSKVANNAGIKWQIIPIGSWNMQTTQSVLVNFVLPQNASIIHMSNVIYDDLNNSYNIEIDGFIIHALNNNRFQLTRNNAGFFVNDSFNDALVNRGQILIGYVL